jgi:hypothetical protein
MLKAAVEKYTAVKKLAEETYPNLHIFWGFVEWLVKNCVVPAIFAIWITGICSKWNWGWLLKVMLLLIVTAVLILSIYRDYNLAGKRIFYSWWILLAVLLSFMFRIYMEPKANEKVATGTPPSSQSLEIRSTTTNQLTEATGSTYNWNALGEQTIDCLVSAANPYWQLSPVNLGTGMRATVTVDTFFTNANAIWIINASKGNCGPGGYINSTAGNRFALPNAPEGCLVMKIGDGSLRYWTNLVEVQTVTNLGPISFIANDDQTVDENGQKSGYADNFGIIRMSLTVSSNQMNNSAP